MNKRQPRSFAVLSTTTAALFALGAGLFIFDFFRHAPRFRVAADAFAPAGPANSGARL